MGYKPFEYGEQLNPEKINSKFSQVFSLVTRALDRNKDLKDRLDMLNTALEVASFLVTLDDDGDVLFDVPQNYKYYDAGIGGDSYEVFLGGEQLLNETDGPTITNLEINGVKMDGHNLVLEEEENSVPISRIPLTENEFAELVPSVGTEITSNNFVSDLTPILSPSRIWAEKVPIGSLSPSYPGSKGVIHITLPDSLSPYLNHVKISPVLGTKYRLYYVTGGVDMEITNGNWTEGTQHFYITSDVFTGTFKLEIQGVHVEPGFMSFGIAQFAAYYNKFVTSGLLSGEYEVANLFPAADISITGISSSVAFDENLKLIIKRADNGDILYDSSSFGFPYPVISGDSFSVGSNKFVYELTLSKNNDTTPTLPYLIFKYKET